MKEGRRAFKTNRSTSVMFGLDNSDIGVFSGVGYLVYSLTDIAVASIVLKAILWGIAGVVTWSVWFRLKDDMPPKIILHLFGWHSTPDVLEVRATRLTPVPLVVNLPTKPQTKSTLKPIEPTYRQNVLIKET